MCSGFARKRMEAPVKSTSPLSLTARKRKFMTISPSAKRRVRKTATPKFMKTPWQDVQSLVVDPRNRNELLFSLRSNIERVTMIQETLLWRKPRAFVTMFGLVNLGFVAWSRFSMPCYCYFIAAWIGVILWRVFDARGVAFAKDTLFSELSVNEEEEIPERPIPGLEHLVKEEPKVEKEPETNKLRDLDQVADIVVALTNPFFLLRNIWAALDKDRTPEGLAVMGAIYAILFWASYVIDWYWMFVICVDCLLLFPGVYCHPTLWKYVELIKEGRKST